MKESIINVFAVVGVSTIIIAIGMFLSIIVNDIRDHIRIMKQEYEIAHRFKKKPLVKCYCIDCRHCRGFVSEHDWEPRAISCDLWGRNIVTYDNSFCYRAEPKM